MRTLFLTATAVVIASAMFTANAQQDWANHNRYAEANAALTVAPDVVFMGNSITDGWDDNHPEFFTDNNFADRGISGQVTTQMLARFYADVIALRPNTVVILGGINDIAQNQGFIELETVAQNIFSMVELARQNGIRPIICSLLPCERIGWNANITEVPEKVRTLNKMLSEYAVANGVEYVDYYSAMTTPEGHLDAKYTADGLHPTKPGYDVMEEVVLKTLNAPKKDAGIKVIGAGTLKKSGVNLPVVGQPIYVIDGVVCASMDDVDANDIATFNNLKPETAKNGVVIITTKNKK